MGLCQGNSLDRTNWKQLACSTPAESISQLCYAQTTEHYSLIKTPIYATRQIYRKSLMPGLMKPFSTCSYSKIVFLGSQEEAKLVYSDRHQSDNCFPGTDKQRRHERPLGWWTCSSPRLRCCRDAWIHLIKLIKLCT